MIKVENVTKSYGEIRAVDGISFEVDRGEILGFLGPNGAGKSTTMKIITGFIPPSAGKVTVAGYDVVEQSLQARRQIGYLPENVPLYTDMTIEDYLTFMGRIREMTRSHLLRRINEVIEICHLEEYRTSHISKLSKGFRQRVGIAQAILHEPDVLVLDEPTIGIDPIQVVETRELIKELGGDRTLIISTHILPEVSMICGRVIIIHKGKIVAVDTPNNLSSRLQGLESVELDIKGTQKEVMRSLRAVEGVQDVVKISVKGGGFATYRADIDQEMSVKARLASAIVNEGWDLTRFEPVGMTLEEIFLQLTTNEEEPVS